LDFVLDIPNLPPVAPDVAAPLNLVLQFPIPPPPIAPAAPAPLNFVLELPNPPPVAPIAPAAHANVSGGLSKFNLNFGPINLIGDHATSST
jgi:hypothetical protein